MGKNPLLAPPAASKTGLVQKQIHHVLHPDFRAEKEVLLKDTGKKLIFRVSFAKWLLRNPWTAQDSRARAHSLSLGQDGARH